MFPVGRYCNEAADEIERLNAEVLAGHDAVASYAKTLDETFAELAAAKEWKDRVIDALVVTWAYQKEHETDPQKAIVDLVEAEIQMALDPQISSDAQRLIDSGKAKHYEECAVICDDVCKERSDCMSGIGALDCVQKIRAALTDKQVKE